VDTFTRTPSQTAKLAAITCESLDAARAAGDRTLASDPRMVSVDVEAQRASDRIMLRVYADGTPSSVLSAEPFVCAVCGESTDAANPWRCAVPVLHAD
jgi:hypothetical protein